MAHDDAINSLQAAPGRDISSFVGRLICCSVGWVVVVGNISSRR